MKEIYIDESRISGTLKQETEKGKKDISVTMQHIKLYLYKTFGGI